ncbi:MAG: hypothetical protein ACR2RA_13335 [Geminicoccaceae bacterium]
MRHFRLKASKLATCGPSIVGAVLFALFLSGAAPGEARVIYVDGNMGRDRNQGKSEGDAVRTLGRAAKIARGGDEIIVGPGIYYEKPTFSNLRGSARKPVWLRASQPGTATISGMWRDAAEGNVKWRRYNNGIYAAPHEPPLFGSFDGTFLFRFNTVKDLYRGRAGDIDMPDYGFAAVDGMVFVKLPDGVNPNGKSLKFSSEKASIVQVKNSPHFVIDGFRIEGAGAGRCIAFDRKSDHAIVRNTVMTYCRHGAQLSDDSLIEWSEYSYPGLYDFVETLRRRHGTTTPIYRLVKQYHPETWLEGGIAISFGYDHASRNCEFRYNFIHQTFDGEQLGQFEYSSSHHNVYMYNYDNHVEFENWAGHAARDLRLHDSLLLASSFGPLSHQDAGDDKKGMVGPHYVYRNVIVGLDDHGWNSWTLVKSRVRNPAFEGLHYYNNLLWSEGRSHADAGWQKDGYLFWDDERRDVFDFRNNIVIFNEANDNDRRGSFRSDHNLFVNAVDKPWLRGANGGYLGKSPDALKFIDADGLNFGLRPGSPAKNAGTALPRFAKTSSGRADVGPFPVGEDPGRHWPRPRRTVFTLTPPSFR